MWFWCQMPSRQHGLQYYMHMLSFTGSSKLIGQYKSIVKVQHIETTFNIHNLSCKFYTVHCTNSNQRLQLNFLAFFDVMFSYSTKQYKKANCQYKLLTQNQTPSLYTFQIQCPKLCSMYKEMHSVGLRYIQGSFQCTSPTSHSGQTPQMSTFIFIASNPDHLCSKVDNVRDKLTTGI